MVGGQAARTMIVERCIDFLGSRPSWSDVRHSVEDRACVNGETQLAWRFQVALVLEFLRPFRPLPNEAVWREAESDLIEGTQRWGFRYFDSELLPADLDTAAAVARCLAGRSAFVENAYSALVTDHETAWPLVPTWLGESGLARRSLLGGSKFHADVLFGFLLTELRFGRPVTLESIERVIEACGLTPYWYLAEAYALFLLSRLVGTANALTPAAMEAVRTVARSTVNMTGVSHGASHHPLIRETLVSERGSALATAYRVSVAEWMGDDCDEAWGAALAALGNRECQATLYWTVGFQPYRSVVVSAALLGTVAGANRVGHVVGKERVA